MSCFQLLVCKDKFRSLKLGLDMLLNKLRTSSDGFEEIIVHCRLNQRFVHSGWIPSPIWKTTGSFLWPRFSFFSSWKYSYNFKILLFICTSHIVQSVQLYYLFMLGGTILQVVSVVGFDVVVVDVVAAVGALFPLFLRNHAQDHLAHLEQRMTNMINNIGEIQTRTYKYDQQY